MGQGSAKARMALEFRQLLHHWAHTQADMAGRQHESSILQAVILLHGNHWESHTAASRSDHGQLAVTAH